MATGQLSAPAFSLRLMPGFDGLRPSSSSSTVKFTSFGQSKSQQKSVRSLVVRAPIFVASKYTSIKPLGDRVLVKIKTAEEKTEGGILLPTTAQTKPQGGEVVAVGEGRTVGKNKVDINVKAGTQIIYSKYVGTELELNGTNHLLLKEDDILGILETGDVKDLQPLNDRVLIKVAEAEEKTAGGLLLTEATKEKPSVGTIIAVGPGSLDDEGNRKPLSVALGNTVMYSKYAGNDFKGSDGADYIVLRSSDVMAVLS
ncbi:hypothetical protein MLD38_006966 [Melastoma candidum]|uniref:Uncharacterized protein n=1 Tax=Melastoma candidum TaxID=119954 RepID=A0ACB9RP42_9MYRT|nr:hypothetical protein MLD38_006966 [Melastoma candidum]